MFECVFIILKTGVFNDKFSKQSNKTNLEAQTKKNVHILRSCIIKRKTKMSDLVEILK